MAAPRKLKIELLYDYWEDEDTRHKAGAVISLPEKEAAEMVNLGKAKLIVG